MQGPNLLGRDWLNVLTLDWQTIHSVQDNRHLYALFQDELGKQEGYKFKLHLDTEAHPKFCKPRPVLLALTKKMKLH